ncbi:hypothetical protein GCM10009751_18970 [Myceligenerans crystallogenes]|uniref:Uncharacterized protein n=1 Tax=Myceligenerans crystallogenes TaxID=316335 RepID=A0ABN2NDJ3_9MICO
MSDDAGRDPGSAPAGGPTRATPASVLPAASAIDAQVLTTRRCGRLRRYGAFDDPVMSAPSLPRVPWDGGREGTTTPSCQHLPTARTTSCVPDEIHGDARRSTPRY